MKQYEFAISSGSVTTDIHWIIDTWCKLLGNGEFVLSVQRKKTQRTVKQNSLMWIWFDAIAQVWSDATGKSFTRQDVHDAYCLMFLPKDTPTGKIPGSTSNLTTEQMSDFMNKVQADASTEYGITLLSPEDDNYEAWEKIITNN